MDLEWILGGSCPDGKLCIPMAREEDQRRETFERVVEGSSDVAAAVKLFTYIASYESQ